MVCHGGCEYEVSLALWPWCLRSEAQHTDLRFFTLTTTTTPLPTTTSENDP